jgi:hypothetical protein
MGTGITGEEIPQAQMPNGTLERDPTLAKGRTTVGAFPSPAFSIGFVQPLDVAPPQPTTCLCSS